MSILSSSRNQRGVTLLEMVLAMAILAVLASTVIPMAEMTVKRTREIELRQALREIRTAIDRYKADYDRCIFEQKCIEVIGESGYPEELELLLEATDWNGTLNAPSKYLRRIPKDPFDPYDEGWGGRSVTDDPDSTVSDGKDVFDVYSQSDATALDATYYADW